eukprot:GSA25T00007321001.1
MRLSQFLADILSDDEEIGRPDSFVGSQDQEAQEDADEEDDLRRSVGGQKAFIADAERYSARSIPRGSITVKPDATVVLISAKTGLATPITETSLVFDEASQQFCIVTPDGRSVTVEDGDSVYRRGKERGSLSFGLHCTSQLFPKAFG